jgi:hypothetical protein
MPDNRNDQAQAHLQARDSAEEKIEGPEEQCCQKIGTSTTT